MFPLPKPSLALSKKWQGVILTKAPFEGFTVLWPGLTLESKMTKTCMGPTYAFVLRSGEYFKYAYCDKDGFKEIPEKWYSKCFQNITEIPQENMVTINTNGVYIEVPFLPSVLFDRKTSTKRRKKTHNIIHTVTYPMWKHQKGKTIHLQVANEFKQIFDKADNGEVELMDPFEGYKNMHGLNQSKTGRQAFRIVAGFVYHQCRDNLGYPVTL